MKNIRFTQTIEVSAEVHASVPDDWTDEDINNFVREAVVGITLDDPDDGAYNGDANITGLICWDASITNGTLLEVGNA